ncbi:MAG: MG2 domain-containing protein [Bacteroides intestinalis]
MVVRKGLDTAMLLQRTSSGSFASWGDDFEEPLNEWELLTDRSLYRPGQTVYVKGIAYTQKGDTADVIPNAVCGVVLRDVNRREISRKELRTNELVHLQRSLCFPRPA